MDVYRLSSTIEEDDFDWEEHGNSLLDEKPFLCWEN